MIVILILFAAVWTTFLTGAQDQDIEVSRRVVNGRTMYRGEWPFLVSLHYLKPFPFTEQSHMKHICGGALIHPRWVLTAAHCMGFFASMSNPEDWEVILGEHNQFALDKGEQTDFVEKFYIHPGFQPNKTSLLSNDIALIKLSQPAAMSQYVSIMELNDRDDLRGSFECEIGGWGQMQSEPYGWGMYIPLKARVDIIDNHSCGLDYKALQEEKNSKLRVVIDDTVLCAGEWTYLKNSDNDLGTDACNGDSGSPLICRTGEEGEFQITGIVSAGEGCGDSKYAGVYTRVSAFKNWIQETTQNQ